MTIVNYMLLSLSKLKYTDLIKTCYGALLPSLWMTYLLRFNRAIRGQPRNPVAGDVVDEKVFSAEKRFSQALRFRVLDHLAGTCEKGIFANFPRFAYQSSVIECRFPANVVCVPGSILSVTISPKSVGANATVPGPV